MPRKKKLKGGYEDTGTVTDAPNIIDRTAQTESNSPNLVGRN